MVDPENPKPKGGWQFQIRKFGEIIKNHVVDWVFEPMGFQIGKKSIFRKASDKDPYIHDIVKELKEFFEMNTQLNEKVRTIEDRWKKLEDDLWDSKEKTKGIIKLYQDVKHYPNISISDAETGWFLHGTGYNLSRDSHPKPKRGDDDYALIRKFAARKLRKYEDKDYEKWKYPVIKVEGYKSHIFPGEDPEILHCFGWTNVSDLISDLNKFVDDVEKRGLEAEGVKKQLRQPIKDAYELLSKILTEIEHMENEYYEFVRGISGQFATFSTERHQLFLNRPGGAGSETGAIRFNHTYKIIRRFSTIKEKKPRSIPKGRVQDVVGKDEHGEYISLNNVAELKKKGFRKIGEETIERSIPKDNMGDIVGKDEQGDDIDVDSVAELENRGFKKIGEEIVDDVRHIKGEVLHIKFEVEESRVVNFEDFGHPNFERLEWEKDRGVIPGYDENNMPLEVDDEGIVLLDKWWYEIGQNEWQRETILKKPGGEEIIKKLDYFNVKGKIRQVDKGFIGDLDLLQTGVAIHNEWDAYRDDTRDGRYHKHSKTIACYTIEADGGFKIAPKKKGRLIPGIKGTIPRDPIKNLNIDPFAGNNYITAKPSDFKKVPKDEQKVKRDFEMKLHDGTPYSGERLPHMHNPAFDRRSLKMTWVHWGRMYYYETAIGINQWSENPYPTISSRGMAHYLIDRSIRSAFTMKDAQDAIKRGSPTYDYGIRAQRFHGIKDVLNPEEGVIIKEFLDG